MKLKTVAQDHIKLCQAYLEGCIDEKTFKTSLMTVAFEAAGVTQSEMLVFNTMLEALYKMKSLGREEIVDAVKEKLGHVETEIIDVVDIPKISVKR